MQMRYSIGVNGCDGILKGELWQKGIEEKMGDEKKEGKGKRKVGMCISQSSYKWKYK